MFIFYNYYFINIKICEIKYILYRLKVNTLSINNYDIREFIDDNFK